MLFNEIQANFDKASRSYDSVAQVQKEAALFLVNKILAIKDFNPKTILDVGTGTGYMPELLIPHYPHSDYTLNDIASGMLERCKWKFAHHSNFTFLQGDMAKLKVAPCDLLTSNLAVQWADGVWKILEFFYAKSTQVFAFSTLLDGTFQEWHSIIQQYPGMELPCYPSSAEFIQYGNQLKGQQDFDYWIRDVSLSFDNPLSWMRYLKSLGASTSKSRMHVSQLMTLIRVHDKPLVVSYKLFFGIFKKVKE